MLNLNPFRKSILGKKLSLVELSFLKRKCEVVEIIDIHCHLTFKEYDADREQVIADARQVLNGVVISGVELEDAKKALELAAMHENFGIVLTHDSLL